MVATITTDSSLQNMRGMLLTADVHSLYQQFGFKQVEGRYMAKA